MVDIIPRKPVNVLIWVSKLRLMWLHFLFRKSSLIGTVLIESHKPREVISPTCDKPLDILIQATPAAFKNPQGNWRRTKLQSHANRSFRMCFWVVNDTGERPEDPQETALMILKIFLITLAQMILLLYDLLPKAKSFLLCGLQIKSKASLGPPISI